MNNLNLKNNRNGFIIVATLILMLIMTTMGIGLYYSSKQAAKEVSLNVDKRSYLFNAESCLTEAIHWLEINYNSCSIGSICKTIETRGVRLIKDMNRCIRDPNYISVMKNTGNFGSIIFNANNRGVLTTQKINKIRLLFSITSNAPLLGVDWFEVTFTSESKFKIIVAPLVGTFYSCPKPGNPPYINIGDQVDEGMTVCIIEAMKIFNDIESEFSGKLVEVYVDDGSPVEYGQELFVLKIENV